MVNFKKKNKLFYLEECDIYANFAEQLTFTQTEGNCKSYIYFSLQVGARIKKQVKPEGSLLQKHTCHTLRALLGPPVQPLKRENIRGVTMRSTSEREGSRKASSSSFAKLGIKSKGN